MFELFSDNERQMMDWYINEFGIDGQNPRYRASLEFLLREWDEQKQRLFELFGNKMILSKPVQIEKDITLLENEMSMAFYGERPHSFIKQWEHFLYNNGFGRKYPDMYRIMQSLESNTYHGSTFLVTDTEIGKEFKVQDGMKIMKILNKVVEAFPSYFDTEIFEDFRIKHSQILNDKFLRGDLHLSIHPLDFMTSSDNNSQWTSCMSWIENGCYHRGTIEMMNSPIVITAYLTADEDMTFGDDFKWNSKKWREFFIVTPTLISGIKGYPYWNKTLEEKVISWIRELAISHQFNYGNFYNDPILFCPGKDIYVAEADRDYNFRFECSGAMYNDFYGDRKNYIAYITNKFEGVDYIDYPGRSECLYCGALTDNFYEEGETVCDDCNPSFICDNCGEHYHGESHYEVDGMTVCQYCYDNMPECAICGEKHTEDNMYVLRLADKDNRILSAWCNVCSKYEFEKAYPNYKISNLVIGSWKRWYDGGREYTHGDCVYVEDISKEDLKKLFSIDDYKDFIKNDYAIEYDPVNTNPEKSETLYF